MLHCKKIKLWGIPRLFRAWLHRLAALQDTEHARGPNRCSRCAGSRRRYDDSDRMGSGRRLSARRPPGRPVRGRRTASAISGL